MSTRVVIRRLVGLYKFLLVVEYNDLRKGISFEKDAEDSGEVAEG